MILSPVHRARVALFLISFSSILFEIALTRLASILVHTAITAVILAACLGALGLGAAYAGRRENDPSLPVRAAFLVSFGAAAALAVLVTTSWGFASGVFVLPFFGAGAFASWTYRNAPIARHVYVADALGGASGAIFASFLLTHLTDVDTALFAALIAALAGYLTAADTRFRFGFMLVPAVFVANLFSGSLAVNPWAQRGFRPHMVLQTQAKHGRVLQTAWDAVARTDLVETDEPWVRYLFTDRMYTARMARWDGESAQFADLPLQELSRLKGLSFRALSPRRVLVMGAGGGFDVALALQSGAQQVSAVEINSAMIRMTQEFPEFTGHIYDRPDVSVIAQEARRFVRETADQFDLVSLSLMQTDPVVDRSNTGFQNWVFTTEAVSQYLDHLAPNGVLSIVQNLQTVTDKTILTCLETLQRRGLSPQQALDQMAVFSVPEPTENPFAHLLVLSRDPFSSQQLLALQQMAQLAGLQIDHLQGVAPSERFQRLVNQQKSATSPVAPLELPTDDRPFFFDLDNTLPALFLGLGLGGLVLLLFAYGRDYFARAGPTLAASGWLVSASVGAGFFLAEMGLISRTQFLLGSPAAAVPLVVGGLLTAAVVGALLGARLFPEPRARLAVGAALVAAVTFSEVLAWPWIAVHAPASDMALAFTVLALVVAVGLPAGFCLPSIFEAHGKGASAAIYTANALATVVASAAGTVIAKGYGLSAVFAAAALSYAATAIVARISRPGVE